MTGILSRGQGDCVISQVSKVSPIQSARAPTHCPRESSVATQFTAQSVMNHQQQPLTPSQSDKGIHHRQCTSIYQQHHPSLNGIMELPSSPSIYQQHHPSLNGMELPSSPFWRSSNLQPDFISALAEGQLCQPGSHQAMNTCLETFQTQHHLKYIDQHYMKPHLRNGFDSPNFCMGLSQPFSPHALPEATTPSSHIPLPENALHQLCYSSTTSTSSSQGMAAAMTPGTPLSGPPLMECSTRKDTLNLGQGATCTSTPRCSHSESTVTHALDIMKGGSSCRQRNQHTQHAAFASHISSSLPPSENYEAINGPSQKVQNAKSKCCRREQESPTSSSLAEGMLSSKNSEQRTFSQVLLQRALLNSFEQRMLTNSKRQRMSKKCGLEHNQCSNSLPNQEALPSNGLLEQSLVPNQEALPSNGLLEQSLVPNHTASPFFASQLMSGATMPQHPLSSKLALVKPAQPHSNSNSPSPSPSPSLSSPTSGDPSQQNSDSQEAKTLFQCLNEGRKQFASHLSSPSSTTNNINFSQLLSTSLNFSYDDNPVIGHRRRPHRRTGSLHSAAAMSMKGGMGSVLQASHSCDLANGNVLSPSSISTYNNCPDSSLSALQLTAAGTLHSHISPFEITNKRKEAVQGAGTSCLKAATNSATALAPSPIASGREARFKRLREQLLKVTEAVEGAETTRLTATPNTATALALSPIAARREARIKSLREQLLKVTEAGPMTLFEEMQLQALKNAQLARERVQQTSLLMSPSASGTSPSSTPAASSPGGVVHAGGSPASITNNYLSCCSSAVSHSSPLGNFSAAAIARTPSEASGLFHSAYEPFAATILRTSHTDLQIDVAAGSCPLIPKASASASPTPSSHQCLQPMSSIPSSWVGLTSTPLPSSSLCMRPPSTVSPTPSLLVADTSPTSSDATRCTRPDKVPALFRKLLLRPHGFKTATTVKKRSVTALEKEAKLNAAAQAVTLDDITAMDDVGATSLSEAHTEGKGDLFAPTRKRRRHSDRTDDLFKRRAMTIELEDVSPVMSQHASALQHPFRMHFAATEQDASALLNPFHENSLRDGTAPLLTMESASSIGICNGVAQADNVLDLNADDLDQLLSEFNEDMVFL
ncbi:hypothetical protein CEUSTIGMA_g12392.t1 [Chlamydomonas eustigma]|uniref:Uncharacterized protein n=1 Tax=Chlamydomonas eustigma TaxID=1157962 RepID=A0A250XPG9_9CHLO|nr:hypothetical protein CEUSTIGMA_g12392.t1 [Chlamydomonas eustigma]|eukprot:GAX84971.1 hypothetical protein CEUSTIGMA_g12392.t1 [Chlamydomonas eustigma]